MLKGAYSRPKEWRISTRLGGALVAAKAGRSELPRAMAPRRPRRSEKRIASGGRLVIRTGSVFWRAGKHKNFEERAGCWEESRQQICAKRFARWGISKSSRCGAVRPKLPAKGTKNVFTEPISHSRNLSSLFHLPLLEGFRLIMPVSSCQPEGSCPPSPATRGEIQHFFDLERDYTVAWRTVTPGQSVSTVTFRRRRG
jgi:hypothetical protein